MQRDAQFWNDAAEALAFLGNSLLAPMSQTGAVGIEPSFWDVFPTFSDARVAEMVYACKTYAHAAQESAQAGGNPVQGASVEYTRLFVGPPHPAAAPWETMYRPESAGATVGFGRATREMREVLRNAGLETANENNQYADHMGIELLFASELCSQVAAAGEDEWESAFYDFESFLTAHPRAWAGKLQVAVAAVEPSGYFVNLLGLVSALLDIIV